MSMSLQIPGLMLAYMIVLSAPMWLVGILFVFSGASYFLLPAYIALFLLLHFTALITTKWLVQGRLRPGAHQVFSCNFVRWWIVYKIMQSFPVEVTTGLLRETPFVIYFYRALGADIGDGVTISGSPSLGLILLDYDLVTIGEGAMVDQSATVAGHDMQRGMLLLGKTKIGARNLIGVQSTVMPGTDLADDVEVAPGSLVNGNARSAPSQYLQGSPCQVVPDRVAVTPMRISWPLGGLQLLGVVLLTTTYVLLPGLAVAGIYAGLHAAVGLYTTGIIMAFITIFPIAITWLGSTCLLKWLLLGRVRAGHYDGTTWNLWRLWLIDTAFVSTLFSIACSVLLDQATRLPMFLRSLGCKVGQKSFINMPSIRVGVEMLSVGDDTMFGSGVSILPLQKHQRDGGVKFAPITLGNFVLCANASIVQAGVTMGNNTTLGIMSVLPSHTVCPEDDATSHDHIRSPRMAPAITMSYSDNTISVP